MPSSSSSLCASSRSSCSPAQSSESDHSDSSHSEDDWQPIRKKAKLYDPAMKQMATNAVQVLQSLSKACENDECVMIATYMLQHAGKFPRIMELQFYVSVAIESTNWGQIQSAINVAKCLVFVIELMHQEHNHNMTQNLKSAFEKIKEIVDGVQDQQDHQEPEQYDELDEWPPERLLRRFLARERAHMENLHSYLNCTFGMGMWLDKFSYH